MNKRQEVIILKLWREWCHTWPEQYGHDSLAVDAGGYDPVFDVIPSQTYIDFYLEVARNHAALQKLNVFEIIDTALNQMRAPETSPDEEETIGSTSQDLAHAELSAKVTNHKRSRVPSKAAPHSEEKTDAGKLANKVDRKAVGEQVATPGLASPGRVRINRSTATRPSNVSVDDDGAFLQPNLAEARAASEAQSA